VLNQVNAIRARHADVSEVNARGLAKGAFFVEFNHGSVALTGVNEAGIIDIAVVVSQELAHLLVLDATHVVLVVRELTTGWPALTDCKSWSRNKEGDREKECFDHDDL